ncbi:MAG: hypothetical protein HN354_12595 [Deltaproteobacteria bacterium]|nr:hypothetical protein [Deltaproteobacteria bacterium]
MSPPPNPLALAKTTQDSLHLMNQINSIALEIQKAQILGNGSDKNYYQTPPQ